jgi:hypothetical protein
MSIGNALWLLPWVAVFAALLVFKRKRDRTADYGEVQAFQAALPWWVGTAELLVALVWGGLFSVGVWKIYSRVWGEYPLPDVITSPGPIYVMLGLGAIILPLALLCANTVSWVIPPLRTANRRAFRGKKVSFSSMNLGLVKFAFVSVPTGLLALLVAAIQPWSSH